MFHTEGRTGRTYILGAESQTELEKWMKLLACASYDFMKLMVVELKHKIQEIEARGAAGGEGEGAEPRPPPRSRHNPFNTGKDRPKHTWLDWHTYFGEKISKDREEWVQLKVGAATNKIEMNGDNLLIVL